MADQLVPPDTITPEQFFEQLMPMGFAAQAAERQSPPADATLQFRLSGAGGGDWVIQIQGGQMIGRKGQADQANLTVTLGVDDWRDAVLERNGASLALVIPQQRPDRPDNSARAMQLKGTLAVDLARDAGEPFKVEMCFNNAAAPRTVIKMKIGEYVAMQTGKLNGQEAFMTGRLRVEGDIAFLMQIATLTA
jgi:putative sterol carrier protein